MKVRVKFEKYGAARFLGHLDTMRYFQKAVRRAKIPIAFSSGFRPHMIMSFAAPLGLGISSGGEYFDMELSGGMSSQDMVRRFNETMAEGFRVISARKVPEGKKHNAMALTAAARYQVSFLEKGGPTAEELDAFYAQPAILVEKKTKSGLKTMDIKPGIYKLEIVREEPFTCSMLLDASSAGHVGPKMVMEAFAAHLGMDLAPHSCYTIHKIEVYADEGTDGTPCLVPLEGLGEEIG